jgi:hypothetical protein
MGFLSAISLSFKTSFESIVQNSSIKINNSVKKHTAIPNGNIKIREIKSVPQIHPNPLFEFVKGNSRWNIKSQHLGNVTDWQSQPMGPGRKLFR